MIDTFTEKAKILLQAHFESMKLVERILYFLAVTNIALLGFSSVEGSVGLALAYSFLFTFFAFGFWWAHSTLEVWNILYEDIKWNEENKDAAEALTIERDSASTASAKVLVICIIGSATFLFLGLLDQFIPEAILPAPSQNVVIGLFVILGVSLLGGWIASYRQTSKSLEDFKAAKAPK